MEACVACLWEPWLMVAGYFKRAWRMAGTLRIWEVLRNWQSDCLKHCMFSAKWAVIAIEIVRHVHVSLVQSLNVQTVIKSYWTLFYSFFKEGYLCPFIKNPTVYTYVSKLHYHKSAIFSYKSHSIRIFSRVKNAHGLSHRFSPSSHGFSHAFPAEAPEPSRPSEVKKKNTTSAAAPSGEVMDWFPARKMGVPQ